MKKGRISGKLRYKGMPVILGVFLLMAAALFAERSGIRYILHQDQAVYLDKEKVIRADEAEARLKKTCLVVMDSRDLASCQIYEQFQQILKDMKVGYEMRDMAETRELGKLDAYETAVILMSDLNPLEEEVLDLAQWVKAGGSAMFAMTLQSDTYISLMQQKLGIMSAGDDYLEVYNFHPSEEFMIGGGRDYTITDPFKSAWNITLSERAKPYAWSSGKYKIPLVWEMIMVLGNLW